jgi:hypothetical protein
MAAISGNLIALGQIEKAFEINAKSSNIIEGLFGKDSSLLEFYSSIVNSQINNIY